MSMTIPSRAALYCRVSTSDQTAENQLRALREHAARAGWVILAEFTDHAVSGTREKRPGLDALMADARRRKFDLIAVAALDRLGRNPRHLVTLLDELQHLGVGLVSLREALDLTSPIGRAMFALVGVLAEVERAWIVERTHAGLRRARAQGKRLGRPRVITDAGKLRQLLANGVSHRAAARTLKVSEGTVRRAVQQDVALLRSPQVLSKDVAVAPALGGPGTFTGLGLVGGGAFFLALALSLEQPGTAFVTPETP